MMPKILIAGAVVLVLGVGAFFLFSRNNSQEITESPTDTLSQNAALSGLDPNSPIICEYTDGTYSTTAYIMQDRARVDGISQGGNTAAVMTRETVWTWDPVTKEGFVVNLNEVNQENVEGMAQDAITRDDLDEKVNSQDANCRNEDFDTSLLTAPTDVTFQDLSQMMNQQMQQMEDEIPQDVSNQIPQEY